jgi:hypothetical protein
VNQASILALGCGTRDHSLARLRCCQCVLLTMSITR